MYASIFKDRTHIAPNKTVMGFVIASLSTEKVDLGSLFFWVDCPEYITYSNFNEWAYNENTSSFVNIVDEVKSETNRLPITTL